MVYVLLNFRKHLRAPPGIDPRSSGPHFSGWHRHARLDSADVASAPDEGEPLLSARERSHGLGLASRKDVTNMRELA
jgi:hypothetical protein